MCLCCGTVVLAFILEWRSSDSQAAFIIKAAAERAELQQEGDSLNEAIKVAEKEIRLLQRTLQSLNLRNEHFRGQFQKSDGGDDVLEQQQLEEQHRLIKTQLLKKKSYFREIATDFEERRRLLSEIQGHIQSLKGEVDQAAREHDTLERAVSEQQEKMDRATRVAGQKQMQLRKAKKVAPDQETLEETDIRLADLNHKNKALMNFVMHFVQGNPSVERAVHDSLESVGLRYPSRPPSASSRASSVGSDVGGSLDTSIPDIHSRGAARAAAPLRPVSIGFDQQSLPGASSRGDSSLSGASGGAPASGRSSSSRPVSGRSSSGQA